MDSTKLIRDQIRITGSDTGGMRVTQECVDFMAEHSLFPETRLISSLEELENAEVALRAGEGSESRYVLDIEKIIRSS